MTGETPRVWTLLGDRKGDNNQALALCEALGIPFETRTLRYNLLRAIAGKYLGPSRITLTGRSKRNIRPPWPDLVIAIGRRSVPVARWIRRRSGGRTTLVLLGHPRVDPGLFDLVITTRQYPVPPGDNVLLLPLAMTRFPKLPQPNPDEGAILDSLPRPHLLMAIGGATKYWRLDSGIINEATERLLDRAAELGGTLIAVGSARTDPNVANALCTALDLQPNALFVKEGVRFAALLGDADEIFVTGDSISMLSEAVQSGKPVGMIPIAQDARGRRKLGPQPRTFGPDERRRDLRRFWNHLEESSLVGSIDEPIAGAFENPTLTARDAVLDLLGRLG